MVHAILRNRPEMLVSTLLAFGHSYDCMLMSRKYYGPAVEEASSMSVEEIDQVVESREDAVAAVVLLDQLPRNMFRGKKAAKVSPLGCP